MSPPASEPLYVQRAAQNRFFDAVYFNERGVRFLRKGLYQNAKSSFAKAVSLTGGRIQHSAIRSKLPSDHPLRTMDDDSDSFCDVPCQQRTEQHTPDQPWSGTKDTPDRYEDSHLTTYSQQHMHRHRQFLPYRHHRLDSASRGYVDRTPMVFSMGSLAGPRHFAANGHYERQGRIQLCVVVLYNYGLAYHLESIDLQRQLEFYDRFQRRSVSDVLAFGMTPPTTVNDDFRRHRDEDRKRSVHLYELSCALSYQAGLDMGWAYRLRLSNNLGQVLRDMGQTDGSDGYFQDLLSCLMYLKQEIRLQSNATTGNDSTMTESDILLQEEVLRGQPRIDSLDAFLENVTSLILTNRNTAAAA